MSRQSLSIFLSVLFLTLVLAPTILMVVDNSIDVSIFYDISEEEEEKESENNKEFEVFIASVDTEFECSDKTLGTLGSHYMFKTYPKPHLFLISPPPESF